GGGRHADFTAQTALTQRDGSALAPVIDDALAAPARAGDWAQWLEALARLERDRLAPLQARLASSPAAQAGLRLVLTGDERLATLVIEPPRGLRRWLRPRPRDWRAWFAA